MTYASRTRKRTSELQVNDMFRLAGINYNIHRINNDDPDWLVIDADQMIGRETWTVTLRLPNDVPFLAQS